MVSFLRFTERQRPTMKAIETTVKIDDRGQLLLDRPLALANYSHVRITVLVPEETDIGLESKH
ncbi:MAG: hypothetical protein HC941_30465 [Microcoleus sp. SU_5_3]|nr:hypothetical protein [Microcoleus sp. SU_5_3]